MAKKAKKLIAAEDYFPRRQADPLKDLSAVERIASLAAMKGEAAGELVCAAYEDAGRIVVACPWCPSAQLASREDRRFWCVRCENARAGGRPLKVVWPEGGE